MNPEKQQYSKVKTRIEGMARIASSVHTPLLFRNSEALNQRHPASDLDECKIPECLKVYLTELDRKLDMLLQLQSMKQFEDSYPIKLEIREISGEGITFETKSDISENTVLEAVLVLEQLPLKMSGAKGMVMPAASEGLWHLSFENIREHDLEAIIQFVFSEQRELIRSHKLL